MVKHLTKKEMLKKQMLKKQGVKKIVKKVIKRVVKKTIVPVKKEVKKVLPTIVPKKVVVVKKIEPVKIEETIFSEKAFIEDENFPKSIKIPLEVFSPLKKKYKTPSEYFKVVLNNLNKLSYGKLPEGLDNTKAVWIPSTLKDSVQEKLEHNFIAKIRLLLYNLSKELI